MQYWIYRDIFQYSSQTFLTVNNCWARAQSQSLKPSWIIHSGRMILRIGGLKIIYYRTLSSTTMSSPSLPLESFNHWWYNYFFLVIVLIQLVQYLVFARISEHRQILRFICIPCILILICFLSIFCILCIPLVFCISCIFYILAVFIEMFKIKKSIFLEAFQRHWDFRNQSEFFWLIIFFWITQKTFKDWTSSKDVFHN